MRGLARELRLAARHLRRHPVFAIAAALTLGLALAISGTMYAVLDSVLHPRAPFAQPRDLYTIAFVDHRQHGLVVAPEVLQSLVDGTPGVSGFAFEAWEGPRLLQTQTEQRLAELAHVGVNFFQVLGVTPRSGRFFVSADSSAADNAIVIGESLWQRECETRPTPGGCVLRLNDTLFHVIGVAPRAFAGAVAAEAWVLHRRNAPLDSTESVRGYVRVRPGLSRPQLQANLNVLGARLVGLAGRVRPTVDRRPEALVVPLQAAQNGAAVPQVLLTIASAIVVLLACCNLASLSIVRATRRRGELALRASLGATRPQLIMTLLVEWMIIVAIGTLLAYLFTVWSVWLINDRMPAALQIFFRQPTLSARVFGFGLALVVASVAFIGAVPAILGSRVDLVEPLRDLSSTVIGRRKFGYRAFLAVELAISLAFVVATSAVFGSLRHASDPHLAVDFEGLYQTTVNQFGRVARPPVGRRELPTGPVSQADEQTYQATLEQNQQMLSAVASSPTTQAAGFQFSTRLAGERIGIAGREIAQTNYDVVSPQLTSVLRTQFVAGRAFAPGDPDGQVAVVDEVLARRLLPGGQIVGHRISLGGSRPSATQVTIIGVIRPFTLSPNDPQIQNNGSLMVLSSDAAAPGSHLLVRSLASRNAELAIARELRSVAPTAKFTPIHRVGDDLALFQSRQAFLGWVLAACGAFELLLAAIGLFGIVSTALVERGHELALRRALGANVTEVARPILREGIVMLIVGSTLGLLLSLLVVRAMRSSVFGVQDLGWMSLLSAEAVLVAVVVVACARPAFRATRVDPLIILRS